MEIMSDISAVIGRISQIEARIASISATPAPQSFGDVLQNTIAEEPRSALPPTLPPASPASLLDPAGQPVRPIGLPENDRYDAFVQQSAAKYGVDPSLVRAVIKTESDGNPKAVSHAGAMGLMQLMPGNVSEEGITDPFDPEQNIDAGTHQLSDLLSQYGGNMDLALAAYNAGPGAVKRYGGVPPYPETRTYIDKIHRDLEGK
jgi:soluble lytic murein transglycosylase-like protein